MSTQFFALLLIRAPMGELISGEKNIGKALNASAEIVNESVKSAKEIQAFGLQSVVSKQCV